MWPSPPLACGCKLGTQGRDAHTCAVVLYPRVARALAAFSRWSCVWQDCYPMATRCQGLRQYCLHAAPRRQAGLTTLSIVTLPLCIGVSCGKTAQRTCITLDHLLIFWA